MAHKPFNLYRRPTSKPGKYIYYVQFYDDTGHRMTARSTGQTSKSAAEAWAIEQLKKGIIPTEKNISFGKFAENFWVWDCCSYVKSRLRRGAKISRHYVDDMRTILERHILPYFKNIKLQKIKARTIENWLDELSKKTKGTGEFFSPTTINRCLTCLKIMLKEAVRLDYLNKNPAEGIKRFRENPKKRSILKIDEVKELFNENKISELWDDLRFYTANLLSATTGMRMGEVQALQVQYVYPGYITVAFNWNYKYGLKEPKWRSYRNIPIPSKTRYYLFELINTSPYPEPDSFVFWGKDCKTPLDSSQILESLYKALKKIGITDEERKKRNITFHSWRHFYNTIMRGKIPDAKLRLLTGHRTEEMIDHYTKFQLEDFQDVIEIQEKVFT